MGVDGVCICWGGKVLRDFGVVTVHQNSCIWILDSKHVLWPENRGFLCTSAIS